MSPNYFPQLFLAWLCSWICPALGEIHVPAGPESPSAKQETLGSSGVAPGASSGATWAPPVPPGGIPKGSGDVCDTNPQIPASVPPCSSPRMGSQSSAPLAEQPKLFQLLFPQIYLGWGRKGEQVPCGSQGQSEITH